MDNLEMYVGKYRVVCEVDRGDNTPIKDDQWIYCKGGGQIYRYDDTTMVYEKLDTKPRVMREKFKAAGIPLLYEWGLDSGDFQVRFDESYMDKVCELVKARTLGANIKPWSKRNLKLLWFK